MKSIEKIKTIICRNSYEASKIIANEIADLIKEKNKKGEPCILGLATGSTPIYVYNELVRLYKEKEISFSNVVTFNLDEYYPMDPKQIQSYHYFMNQYLFNNVDIDRDNINIPDGTIPYNKIEEYCIDYEEKIKKLGGIDLQLLGIGRTGHIGFNEPGSSSNSITRLITLDRVTRMDASSNFFGEKYVLKQAITMGVGTILRSKKIILIAFGEHKSHIIANTIEGNVTKEIAASYLQEHPNTKVILDSSAAAELTRIKTPWLLGPIEWNNKLAKKAVIWLAKKMNKPVLKLTQEDYAKTGLYDMLSTYGSAYTINLSVFKTLQKTITGWPGGKPDDKDPKERPWRTHPFPKRILVFSPHPDDDVISMGGTIIRLVDQGHDVHIAYQTNGNVAVFDYDVIRFADFVSEFSRIFNIEQKEIKKIEQHVEHYSKRKEIGKNDSNEVKEIKILIRKTEAKAAARACGIIEENLHFLDMPFYRDGTIIKNALNDKDILLITEILEKVKPNQIYAAGDLSDPHGTHRICFNALLRAFEKVKLSGWFKKCQIWLYRGAWQEWDISDIEMAVPLSPDELKKKRLAIFKHQSQKDPAMFPGPFDKREFWQRAEERNKATAEIYDKLGLAEYEAIEAFCQLIIKKS